MIVVPALHPAHEVVARVERLTPGAVHRVGPSAMATGLGGKALNVARFAAAMGAPVRLVLLGDPTLGALADEMRARTHSLDLVLIPSPVPSRTDLAVVDDSGQVTVVNGTAADPGAPAVAAVHAAAMEGLGPGDVLVLSGSTPEGTLPAHPGLALDGRRRGAAVVADASGPWLRELAATGPFAVKISAAEADELAGAPSSGGRPAAFERVPVVAITDGARGLRAWLPDGRAVRVVPPPGMRVVSPLGAGDAVTAGLAIALARGAPPLEGLVLGTAMAAASLAVLDATLLPAEVAALRDRVVVESLA